MSENKNVLTIRVSAQINKIFIENKGEIELKLVDAITRNGKTYYGYEVILDASQSWIELLPNFSRDTSNAQLLYFSSQEEPRIQVAIPEVETIWQQMLLCMCKNHVFTFILEFKDKKYNLKGVEY